MTVLHLLRHARVASHAGDMPLAEDAAAAIDAAAERIGAGLTPGERIVCLSTGTRRTRETAEALGSRLEGQRGARIVHRGGSEALRNPDLWLGGHRVEMVSTAAAFAAQLPEGAISEAEVMGEPFFAGFLMAPDRIGHWLNHPAPPGEAAPDVARRVLACARSFHALNAPPDRVLCVTHSPVLRAVICRGLALSDPGEPDWVESVNLVVGQTNTYRFRAASGAIPTT